MTDFPHALWPAAAFIFSAIGWLLLIDVAADGNKEWQNKHIAAGTLFTLLLWLLSAAIAGAIML